ncbi:unnamed protein product [Acanthoscelides obtectus]|uniref:MADF domain-containing protein n=1 Tax=Acanthoscelides obtectus TaxID=200917 RepID=A0A9P0P3M9_ACAOB|nr:unnamed protein product [Acanthoscelides obtectus]CAK1669595.1 hypothetical protein AOBTE_LOCUS27099 [Acanthoscelides obtectus]
MSLIYNNEDDQIIIDEALDEAETASPTQANDNTSPDKPEKMILPVISSVYSENPAEQHTDNRKEAFGCNNVATDGCQQDNDSHYSDSDVELVSVDYTNDTLSDSSQNNEISNIAQPIKKVRRKKRSTQKTEKAPKAPKQNPCQDKTCRNECNSFTEDERQVMFEEFKSLNEGEKRAYIQKWVNVKLPNHSLVNGNIIPGKMLREYYLLKQDQAIPIKVCCQFFCATLGVSPGTLRKALQGVFNDVNRSMDVTEENIALGNKTIRINVIDLIKQIQRKEEIWNPDMPIEDRLGVDESWNEICIALVEDYSKHFFQEQEYLKKRIVAKWCDIKSTYFQYSMRKRFIARINPGATPPFMAYSHLLSFLDQTKDFCLGASTEDCSSDKPDGFASVFIVGNNIETEPPEAPELEVCFAIGDDAQLAKKRRLETENK